jgi:hypothetical protein
MTLRLDYVSRAPMGMKAFGGVHAYVAGCGLTKPLIDLVYLRASQINECRTSSHPSDAPIRCDRRDAG